MCINIGGSQSQINALEQSNQTENKKNIENGENNNQEFDDVSPFAEPDNAGEVKNKYPTSNYSATIVSFDNEPDYDASPTKMSDEDMTIVEFISSMNDKTMKAVLDAFDRMLESSRRMREENERFYLKVTQPKQEAMKKEILKEEILKSQSDVIA